MPFVKLKFDVNYSQVPNQVWSDNRLNWKEKAIFGYLMSKPNGWNFAYKRIAEDSSDGERVVLMALRGLEKVGYLKRVKIASGSVEYQLFLPDPVAKTANCGKRRLLKAQTAESAVISNTEDGVIQNDKKDGTVVAAASENSKEIAEVINVFKELNPVINFGQKTFRQAAADLIKQFGFEAALNTARAAIAIQGQRFAPVITNPYQLKLKLAELGVYLKKEHNKFDVTVV